MLQQALNRHSQIVIPPETKYFCSFVGHSRDCQRRHLKRVSRDLQIEMRGPTDEVRSLEQVRLYYDELSTKYTARIGRTGAAYFGEKTPEHAGHLERIQRTFPFARILYLYRDGRDVAVSMSRVPWMTSNVYVTFAVWLYYYERMRRALGRNGSCVLCVKYEQLVSAPALVLRQVSSFLGLEYESSMALGCGNSAGIPDREFSWKASALRAISPERVGEWQRCLSDQQIANLERMGGKALRSLGYEVTGSIDCPFDYTFYPRLMCGIAGRLAKMPLDFVVCELVGRPLCRLWN
jgi:hypothetical protein